MNSKIHMKVTIDVCLTADTEELTTQDILDALDVEITSSDESVVFVEDTEILSGEITDAR